MNFEKQLEKIQFDTKDFNDFLHERLKFDASIETIGVEETVSNLSISFFDKSVGLKLQYYLVKQIVRHLATSATIEEGDTIYDNDLIKEINECIEKYRDKIES